MILDAWEYIKEWWTKYQADPRADSANIESGLKKEQTRATNLPQNTEKSLVSNLQTAACQYWVKGLPSVCSYWNQENFKCTYSFQNSKDQPSGYGIGGCDGLGRRAWCDKYSESKPYEPNEYACVLPCIEKSGSGKRRRVTTEVGEHIVIEPWRPEEIAGYNPDGNGVGRCDNNGMGRGLAGFEQPYIENLYFLPAICKHYKPQQMGFGAVDPKPYHGDPPSSTWKPPQTYIPRTPKTLHDGSWADPLTILQRRLPFSFAVYNQRARFQKCAHWDADTGASFFFDDYGADPSYFQIQLEEDPVHYCKLARAGNSLTIPFTTVSEETDGIPYVLWDVWADGNSYGGVVCNGAKPECPCYTGRWIYCTDRNMQDGMRITADQIFELRFWASNWSSQEEYDRYYEAKPGITKGDFADITTADIYTFTRWLKLDPTDPNESIMEGKRHHMCMPAPLNNREFDSKVYITKTLVQYPKASQYGGTTTPAAVAFPTLVRELDDPYDMHPDILVVFPYSNNDPWLEEPCSEIEIEPYYHNHNFMYDDPSISVVGSCIRNRKVWALNMTYLYEDELTDFAKNVGPLAYMKTYVRSQLIPEDKYHYFCRALEEIIEEAIAGGSEGIVSGETDENGFFRLDGLKLTKNSLNEIFVICQFDSLGFPRYAYRYRQVYTRYFGGLILQSDFIHTYGESDAARHNNMMNWFTPAASMAGEVKTVNGLVKDVFSVYSHYQYGIMDDISYFSYCINEYEETLVEIDDWVQVGSTGYIWVEIPNTEISYLWDFEVAEAYMYPKAVDDKADNPIYRASLCGTDANDHAELFVTLTHVKESETTRRAIPPSAVLLKSDLGPRDFFNKDWTLKITYKYQLLEPFMTTPVWPPNIDNPLSLNRFVDSPFVVNNISEEENNKPNFEITEVGGMSSRGTAAVMALITDPETGRIQAAAATKLLFMGNRLSCRTVEIYYAYGGPAEPWVLIPKEGFFTFEGKPESVPAKEVVNRRHYNEAKCGDHDCSPEDCIGPMWYPFNACNDIDFYNVLNGAASCTRRITEADKWYNIMGPGAFRYQMAEEYFAWVLPGHNWAANCGSMWTYYYSHCMMSNQDFMGWGNEVGKVDEFFFNLIGWQLPTFGNSGRALVERFIIRDFAAFYNHSGPEIKPDTDYMPMVFDREDIVSDIDCFKNAGISSHPNLQEPFYHRSMLSNYKAGWLNETILAEDRFRFEEILYTVHQGNCMYPWPALETPGGYRITRYAFTNNDYVWAWPEYWRNIERYQDGSDTALRFIELDKQNYYYDLNKYEHRFVPAEGEHTLYFTPPEISESDAGNPDISASVSLDGVHWRFFKINYDDYSSGYADWLDESVGGEDGSSGGENESGSPGNIFEEANNGLEENGLNGTNNPQWIHDFNTLFDEEAVPEISEDRKALIAKDQFTGEDIYGYYNRGLIVKIPKNRLNQLPYETLLLDGLVPENASAFSFGQVFGDSITFGFSSSPENTPIRVIVEGVWGAEIRDKETVLLSQPGIEIGEAREEDEVGQEFPPSIYSQSGRSGRIITPTSNYIATSRFELDIKLSTYPDRLGSPPKEFKVKLTPSGGESLKITAVIVFGANYRPASEKVKVWERMFKVSVKEGVAVINPDGTSSKILRDYDHDRKNAGQYYPKDDAELFVTGIKLWSKMTMVGVGEMFEPDPDAKYNTGVEGYIANKKNLHILSTSHLKQVETSAQGTLYDEAYNQDNFDEVSLGSIYAPEIEYFLKEVLKVGSLKGSALKMTDEKVPWLNSPAYKSFVKAPFMGFWQPGGHYFGWEFFYTKQRCYLFGDVKKIYYVDFLHHLHGYTDPRLARVSALQDDSVIDKMYAMETGHERPMTPQESYVGWGRLEYLEGRFFNAKTMGITDTGQPTDVMSGAKNQTLERS